MGFERKPCFAIISIALVLGAVLFPRTGFCALSATSISPAQGGTGIIVLAIGGSGFQSGATVTLQLAGSPNIVSTSTSIDYTGTLDAVVDFTGQALGVYDVVVTNPDTTTSTLPQAFTLQAAQTPALAVVLIGGYTLRAGGSQVIYAEIFNGCNIDIYYPELILNVPAFVTAAVPLPPTTNGPSFESTLVGDASAEAELEKLLPAADGSLDIDLLVTAVPAGGSTVVPIRLTCSTTASGIGMLTATTYFSTFDYNNFDVFTSNTSNVVQSAHGFPRDDVYCVKAVLKDAVAKYPNLSKGERTKIDADIDANPFPGIQARKGKGGEAFEHASIIFSLARTIIEKDTGRPSDRMVLSDAVAAAVNDVNPNSKTKATGDLSSCRSRGLGSQSSHPAKVTSSSDPNDKFGPYGPGAPGYIARGTTMTYSIQFQNDPTATAPVQHLVVTDTLDATTLDPTTVVLGAITFADQVVTIPSGQNAFAADVDLRPAKNLIVRLNAGVTGNQIQWTADALDPVTLQPTNDPTLGFLDPDVMPPQGEGGVIFTVKQQPNLAVGTAVSNSASITFDQNSPIDTPTWTNTIALLDIDTDGDGFPDDLEIAAGTDPNDPNSTPLGPGTFEPYYMGLTKMQLKLDFTPKHNDSLQVTGSLYPALPAGFTFTGQTVQIFIGGIFRTYVLNSKGQSPASKTESFSLKVSKKGTLFSFAIKTLISPSLADRGFDATETIPAPKTANRKLPIYILFNNTFDQATADLSYGSKQGVSGSAKLAPTQ